MTPAFGRALHRYLYSREPMKLLANGDCGWLDGGCWILAEALRDWLGRRDADLRLVRDAADRAQHVLLALPQGLLDGDGLSSASALLRRWERWEHLVAPRLTPFDPAPLQAGGIPRDPLRSARLVTLLERRFGAPKP